MCRIYLTARCGKTLYLRAPPPRHWSATAAVTRVHTGATEQTLGSIVSVVPAELFLSVAVAQSYVRVSGHDERNQKEDAVPTHWDLLLGGAFLAGPDSPWIRLRAVECAQVDCRSGPSVRRFRLSVHGWLAA